MSLQRTCDKCHGGSSSTNPVERYLVRRYKRLEPGQTSQNRSNRYQGRFEAAGSIDLCRACWERICQPRMRRGRSAA